MESKYTHLQQMRENEARREVDRELDKMWYDLAMKEAEKKINIHRYFIVIIFKKI